MKKRLVGLLLLCITANGLFYACHQNKELTPSPKSLSKDIIEMSIPSAQKWYEENLLISNIGRNASKISQKKSNLKISSWDLAKEYGSGKNKVIIIPIVYLNQIGARIRDSKKENAVKNYPKWSEELNVKSSLLIFNDDNGKTQSLIVKVIGDQNYLSSPKNKITPKDFSGQINYYSWDEEFLKGYEYKNGVVSGYISASNSVKNGKIANGHWERVETDWYTISCFQDECNVSYNYTDTEYVWVDDTDPTSSYPINSPELPISIIEDGGGTGSELTLNDIFIEEPCDAEKDYYYSHMSNFNYSKTQIKLNADIATQYTRYFYCSEEDGTNANAFKHALWNALNTISWGVNIAKEMADAHENCDWRADGSYPPLSIMDFHNNQLGRDVAFNFVYYGGNPSDKLSIAKRILCAIKSGEGNRLFPTQGNTNNDGICNNRGDIPCN